MRVSRVLGAWHRASVSGVTSSVDSAFLIFSQADLCFLFSERSADSASVPVSPLCPFSGDSLVANLIG